MKAIQYNDHGTTEGFCARCDDHRPFTIKSQDPPGIAGAFCLKCDWAVEACDLPHDAEQSDEWLESGRIRR